MALSVCGLHAEAEAAYRLAGRPPAGRRQLVQLLPGRRGEGPPPRHQRVRLHRDRGLPPLPRDRRRRRSAPALLADRRGGARLRAALPAGRRLGAVVGRPGRAPRVLRAADRLLVDLPRRCAARSPSPSGSGKERPDWELAAGRLGHAVAHHARSFAPKDEFAMDWYYPVLAGALAPTAARHRIESGWDRFVIEGRGVRCVVDQDWVTAAETAECVLALDALGLDAAGPGAVRGRAGAAAGRRLLLDRDRLPRGADLPGRRADHLHGRRHGPGRRRAERRHAGLRAVPGRGSAGAPRPARVELLVAGSASARPGAATERAGRAAAQPGSAPTRRRIRRLPCSPSSSNRPTRARRSTARRGGGRRRPGPGRRRGWRASRPTRDEGGPAAVVGPGRLGAVAAVDEAEGRAGCASAAATVGESPTTPTTQRSRPARATVRRQWGSVSSRPSCRVDQVGVVVLPARPGSPPSRGGGRR